MRVPSDDPPNLGVGVEHLNGDLLSQGQMYVRCNFAVPSKAPDGFDLVVPGTRSRFVDLGYLAAFETVEREIVLECAGNGRSLMSPVPEGIPWDLDAVSPVRVSGHRLCDVLGAVPDDVVEVVFTGADAGRVEPEGRVPFQFSISRDLAISPVPLLVTRIGGEPLDMAHGAPVRLVVPGHYAMMSVKWLVRVEATTARFEGHFVRKYRYYTDDREPEQAPVREMVVRSVIAAPVDGDKVRAGSLRLMGSAWSGSTVVTVEVSIDGGTTWIEAELGQSADQRWAPVRWWLTVEPNPGPLQVIARATDITGDIQPLEPRWNANGYANNVAHRVTVDVAETDST